MNGCFPLQYDLYMYMLRYAGGRFHYQFNVVISAYRGIVHVYYNKCM